MCNVSWCIHCTLYCSLAKRLTDCPPLELLDLTFNTVGDVGGMALGGAIAHGSKIKILKLYRCVVHPSAPSRGYSPVLYRLHIVTVPSDWILTTCTMVMWSCQWICIGILIMYFQCNTSTTHRTHNTHGTDVTSATWV